MREDPKDMYCGKCIPNKINLLFCFSFTESQLCKAFQESLISETYLYIQTLLSFDFIYNMCVCTYMHLHMAVHRDDCITKAILVDHCILGTSGSMGVNTR